MLLSTELKRHAKLVAKDVKAGKASTHSRRARDFMEDHPGAILDLIDLVHRAANRKKPNEAMVEAYGYMFRVGLELLRFEVESGHDWAEELVDEVRDLLLLLASGGVISFELLVFLVNGFVEAKLDPGEGLSELVGKMTSEAAMSESLADLPDLSGLLESLANQFGSSDFDLHAGLNEVGQALPPEFRETFVGIAAASEFPVLRDSAVFYLLDASPEVRRTARQVMAEHASPSLVSPVALRRMIALRNWLPEAERHALDGAIGKARRNRVECASWPKTKVEQVLASNIDGVGAQSVFAVIKDGRKRVVAALLLKVGVGIADAWCMRDQSRTEVEDLLGHLDAEMESIPVGLEFLDVLVPHYLAIGHRAGNVPPAGLLDFVEAIGGGEWHPTALAIAQLITRLEKDVAPALLGREAIEDAVKRSGDWFDEFEFTMSWFEDDAEVAAILSSKRKSKHSDKVDAVLESVLEPRREKWIDRFLWTAFWLKQDADLLSPWCDFLVVGRELHQGRPAKDIPAMHRVAEATVLSHVMR